MQSHNNSHIFMVNGICEYTHRPKIDGRPSDRPTDCDDVHNGDIVRQMNEMQSTYAAVAAAAVVTDKKRYNARRTRIENGPTHKTMRMSNVGRNKNNYVSIWSPMSRDRDSEREKERRRETKGEMKSLLPLCLPACMREIRFYWIAETFRYCTAYTQQCHSVISLNKEQERILLFLSSSHLLHSNCLFTAIYRTRNSIVCIALYSDFVFAPNRNQFNYVLDMCGAGAHPTKT